MHTAWCSNLFWSFNMISRQHLFFVFVCSNRSAVSLYDVVCKLAAVCAGCLIGFNQHESMQIHVSSETANSNVSIVTSMTVVCECRWNYFGMASVLNYNWISTFGLHSEGQHAFWVCDLFDAFCKLPMVNRVFLRPRRQQRWLFSANIP